MAWELDVRAQNKILQNSIERVINTAIRNAQLIASKPQVFTEAERELADVNEQDWEDLKQVVCNLWDRERDAIFRERLAAEQAKKGGA